MTTDTVKEYLHLMEGVGRYWPSDIGETRSWFCAGSGWHSECDIDDCSCWCHPFRRTLISHEGAL